MHIRGKIKFVQLFCLVWILSGACAPISSTTTSAPTEGPVEFTASAEEHSTTPLPTVTAAPEQLDFSPVLYKQNLGNTYFLLLGGVSGDVWLAHDLTATRFANAAEYDIYSPNEHFQMFGDAPKLDQLCDAYFIGTDAQINKPGLIGVAQGWQVTQRDVEQLSSQDDSYQHMVTDRLIKEGISNPEIDNLGVLRVDIEGDGMDEIFLSAYHFKDEAILKTEAGDYSIILMRKVVGNDVITLDVTGEIYHSQEPESTFPFRYSLANFIDLNQDGNLEVIVEINRLGGYGAAVYQIDDQDVILSLQAICTP